MSFHRSVLPVTFFSLALAGCSGEVADPRTQPALVEVATLKDGGASGRTYTGVVSARVQSDLGFRVAGKVIERLVDTGQFVHRGQILMRIDRTDYALAATAAGNSVDAARARALQTAADEKRFRDLVSAGAVSASRYDQAKADADAARAQLAAAIAQVGTARNAVGYSELLADSDGVVVETLAEPGHVVSAGQTVVRLAHSGPREATISLPEGIRPALDSSAQVSLYGGHGTAGVAHLRQLSDAADPQTRTFDARYVLEGEAATAPLGATVSIALTIPGSKSVATIPLSALFDNGHGSGVWKLVQRPSSLTVHWTPVTVAGLNDETASISGGLNAGDRFVALGAHLLHEGEQVRLSSSKLVAAQ